MSAMLRTIGRLMTAFALLIGVSAGTVAIAGPAQAARAGAYQVTVTRTGGFIGVNEAYMVFHDTAHVSTPALMTAVEGREFRHLCASYPPAGNGADRFVYTVSVTYRNGVTKTIVTEDGADAPELLWRVIGTTLQITRDLAATTAG